MLQFDTILYKNDTDFRLPYKYHIKHFILKCFLIVSDVVAIMNKNFNIIINLANASEHKRRHLLAIADDATLTIEKEVTRKQFYD